MKKRKIDRAALEAQMREIEQTRPMLGIFRTTGLLAIIFILAMAFTSCRSTKDSCQYVRDHYVGYK